MPKPWSAAAKLRSWVHVVGQAATAFQTHKLSIIASGVAFRATLAVFPGIAVLVWVSSQFIGADELRAAVTTVASTMPQSTQEIIRTAMDTQLAHDPGAASSLGFLGPFFALALAAWSASSGFKAILVALNTIFDRTESRHFLRLTVITFAFTGGALFLSLVGIALIVAGPFVLSLGGNSQGWPVLLTYFRWPILVALSTAGVGTLYRYAPNREGERAPQVTYGSFAAALALTGCSALFSRVLAHVASLSVTYGSLSTVIAFMIWLWLSTTLVLAGAELDAALKHGNGQKSKEPQQQ
ncbi:YihY/virulence factor BrkB family protein [Mesorhizobium sp. ES1-3]|uniref:YihY/virulence factor BrkB family protein n=1 Tax=Mesorhizobium sp. ES1-3 TaxID=2876628 RepID=UPI001CCFE2C6|nr:YihY/virulence factor BrkB family protein [Mesorhizobium sp. ES1-3]MBZ9673637.1 YihY/virulence factor BrkB family protein [Mesorhizobium sp. ES1-3]